MSQEKLTVADYPLAEKRPDLVRGTRGKTLDEITLDALERGQVGMEDLRITGAALRQQAEIARAAGRETLAENFERAAELTSVPEETIMAIYELLRPGRAKSKEDLLQASRTLSDTYGAVRLAAFVAEAAHIYDRRGLFKTRY